MLALAKKAPSGLSDRFWLPYHQKDPSDLLTWFHIETGAIDSKLPWRRGQVFDSETEPYLISFFLQS